MNRDAPDFRGADAADDPRDFEIETALGRLPLRSPSAELDAGIARLVRAAPRRDRTRPLIFAVAAVVAIAMGTIPLVLRRAGNISEAPVARGPVDKPRVKPSASPLRVERQIARVADDGVIGTARGVPVQLLHYSAVRQIWYFDPRTGRRLEVIVPRDQAFLVAVRTF